MKNNKDRRERGNSKKQMSKLVFTLLFLATVTASDPLDTQNPFKDINDELRAKLASFAIRSTVTSTNFSCIDAEVDCSDYGRCNSKGTACICDSGYVTAKCDPAVQCCYAQVKRVKMFLLSFFVGWTGAPYFVIGQDGLGAGILVLFIGGLIVGCIGQCTAVAGDDTPMIGMCIMALGWLAFFAACVWHLALWICYAASTDPWNDQNGVPVGPW